MRKTIAMILALIMVLSMSTVAFAAETLGQNDSQNIDVTAKYSDSVTTPVVYSVDLTWDSMTFTYSEAGTMDWDPETHTYTENITAGWDETSADITVTNHSNVDVDVVFDYVPVETFGVQTELEYAGLNILMAPGAEGEPDTAASITAVLTVSGTPNENVTAEGVVVGTITVTVD